MIRPLLLASALALVVGCKKADDKPTPTPGPSGTEPGDGPSAGGVLSPGIPKLQARAKFKLPGERVYERAVQLSADGKTLAVAHTTKEFKSFVQVWDVSGEPKAVAELEGGNFALSPSGKLLLSSANLTPTVFEVASKKSVATLPGFFSHGYFRDENTVVTTQRSHNFPEATKGRITVWDVTKNADAGSFDIPDNRFSDALPAHGGKEFWLFMSHDKFEVECYDIAGKKLARTVKPEPEKAGQKLTGAGIWCSVAPDSSAFASDVSGMRFYDATSGKIVGKLPPDIWGTPTGFIPGPGHRYLARASAQGTGLTENDYVIYDWKANKALAVLTGHAATDKEPLAGASGDGKTLVSVTKGGDGLVFDLSGVK